MLCYTVHAFIINHWDGDTWSCDLVYGGVIYIEGWHVVLRQLSSSGRVWRVGWELLTCSGEGPESIPIYKGIRSHYN